MHAHYSGTRTILSRPVLDQSYLAGKLVVTEATAGSTFGSACGNGINSGCPGMYRRRTSGTRKPSSVW